MAQDYNKTINLPKTEFPMRGNLPVREPETLEKWEKNRVYYKLVEKNAGKPKFVLHDGPPYANGEIHLGTALNKILKDIINKYKSMNGFCVPYVPGWDTHGLPIELKAMKAIGVENGAVSPEVLRKHCREFALSCLDGQKKQFKRLGVWADYDDPYLTLKPEFEAKQVEVFGKMAKAGYMYKGLKPVHWCPDCKTALAEAEIEYANDTCFSIYVKFKVADDLGVFSNLGVDMDKIYFVIWTTTTWTLPGNLAICVGPDYEYTLVKVNDEYYCMARDLVDTAMAAAKIENYECVGSFKGSDLENIKTNHPFIDRFSPIIVGDHVTLESGTGCVHTAPGHGVEDFEVCKKYPEIPIIVPVDASGRLNEQAGQFAGLTTDEANKAIAEHISENGSLLAIEKIEHQYPHCWRCKNPVIFRATEQWFCSVKDFRDETVKAIEQVKWYPAWGEDRIKNMVMDRSDWCISRQRTWGVPIPVIYCKDCGKPIITDETIKAISELFAKESSDAWYTTDVKDFIPSTVNCDCGCDEFVKETDIFDVWFDSGVSHAAVLENYDDLCNPCDLYLEGNDQYRGWFQSSLLTSVVWQGCAPYKQVCTHGMVVDEKGKFMHKSAGNGIAPEEIIKQYGGDVLRLWVASSDYHSDIKTSHSLFKQLSEAYKKFRNTARFILGNLTMGEDKVFNPESDVVADNEFFEIDKWALMRLDRLIDKVKAAYDEYEFHIVFHEIHNFCVREMSNFYLDIIKDRLYCTKVDSVDRRSALTAMYRILSGVARLIAPILTFTADEIWSYMPHLDSDDKESVFFNDLPSKSGMLFEAGFVEKWDNVVKLREEVNKALEVKRSEKLIGAPLEACLTINNADKLPFDMTQEELAEILIVSKVVFDSSCELEFASDAFSGVSYGVAKTTDAKCERCWKYSETVGTNSEHPTLCARCADNV